MLTSKQRSALLGLGNSLSTLAYIGKNGISDAVIKQLDEMLEQRELIKIGVQRSVELNPKDIIDTLAQRLKAEPVHTIGSKIILYRRSSRKDIEHLVF